MNFPLLSPCIPLLTPMPDYLSDKVEVSLTPKEKSKMREHAKRAYGLLLGTWARMLMRQDYNRHHPDEDQE